jgi:hypothetical protein
MEDVQQSPGRAKIQQATTVQHVKKTQVSAAGLRMTTMMMGRSVSHHIGILGRVLHERCDCMSAGSYVE